MGRRVGTRRVGNKTQVTVNGKSIGKFRSKRVAEIVAKARR
jgi:hypothetical protein